MLSLCKRKNTPISTVIKGIMVTKWITQTYRAVLRVLLKSTEKYESQSN